MKHIISIVCLSFLVACGDTTEHGSSQSSTLDRTLLEGEWNVVSINGEAFDEIHNLELKAGPEIAEWNPGCQQLMQRYWIDGKKFAAQRLRYTMSDVDTPTSSIPPPCLLGLLPGLEDVMFAFDTADTIEDLDDSTIRVSGGGRSVTLERR